MARVLLVSFAGYPYTPSSLMPDNGLGCLAGCLADAGHQVKVLDYGTVSTLDRLFPPPLRKKTRPLAEKLFVQGRKLSILEKIRFLRAGMRLDSHQRREMVAIAHDVAEEAAAFGADVVGFKLWNGDGFTGSVRIADAVRRRLPRARIIGGGPQVDYFHGHILDYTDVFDVLVRGDGERVLPALVDAMDRGMSWQSIAGTLWKEAGKIRSNPVSPLADLNELSMPLYDPDVYPALRGDDKVKLAVLDESRGCPNRCAFCIHPIKSGGTWQLKSPARVVREMRRLMAQIGTRYFIYSGSNTSARVAVGIARAIIREGLDVRYGCFGHVRGIARADFDLLRSSGCEAIFYGLESASPRILRRAFNKPLNPDNVARVIQQTKDAGICAITSVIFPAPFEDDRSRAETLEFLRRVRPHSVPVTIPGVIPGTSWHTQAGRYGFEMSKRKDLWEYALTYKIKLLFPPSMWKPLPYRLNGKSSRKLLRECTDFVAELERSGLLTHVPHELVLMAHALGEQDDLKRFRDRTRAMFLSGDADGIREMVTRINKNVAVRRMPLTPTAAGVGV